jgi:hypothetical protein
MRLSPDPGRSGDGLKTVEIFSAPQLRSQTGSDEGTAPPNPWRGVGAAVVNVPGTGTGTVRAAPCYDLI